MHVMPPDIRVHICHCFFHITLQWSIFLFFFFNDPATTEIYPLSLHDALPISPARCGPAPWPTLWTVAREPARSEEHTSELQSPCNLVCRLLLEKKKKPSAHHCLKIHACCTQSDAHRDHLMWPPTTHCHVRGAN